MTQPIKLRILEQVPPAAKSGQAAPTDSATDRPARTASAGAFLRGLVGGAGDTGRLERVRSLYIHIPFCFHKCHYCDFYSIVDSRDRQAIFVDRLERELAALAPLAGALDTIFVGGGTPSLLRVDLWERLLARIGREFDLSRIFAGHGEFTVECNPETVTPDLMRVLRAGGVDRVSVGAQSFNPTHLKTLERWHDPANVARALTMAADAGIARRSLDLIFGIPGQTLDDWRRDLDLAVALGTEHLSCYNLTYEPNTAMTTRLKRGEFSAADEDLEVEMFDATLATLRGAGFDRYEVSNYSRPGAESLHNRAYWLQHDWLAAGPSASGHVAGHRWKNSPRLDDFLSFDDAGFASCVDHETPDPARAVRERIMMGIRLSRGLDVGVLLPLAAAADPAAADRLRAAAAGFESQGLLSTDTGRWRLTDAGFLLCNTVTRGLMNAVRRS